MKYLVLLVLYAALVAYCLTDVFNREEREPFGLHKALWVVLIILLPYAGPVIWLIARVRTARRYGGPGPLGPDDDPEYLRWLRDRGKDAK